MKYALPILGIIALLIAGYLLGIHFNYKDLTDKVIDKEIATQIDTVYIPVVDTLYIQKEHVKTYYYNSIDTIFITQEFEKSIDTTIDESTIHVSYYFPQDSFKIRFQTAMKEIMRTDTVKSIIQIPLYKEDKVKYYSMGIAGFGVGLLIGVLIK